ncbi:MAG: hypothetical protein PHS57_05235 [Alphaproteobacteria bacterium]|nr:hypothetical protein [Alphaproteobacteria bacterium]
MAQASGHAASQPLNALVTYRPERQAFHWTLVYTNFLAVVQNDEDLEKTALDAFKEIRPTLLPVFREEEVKRQKLERAVQRGLAFLRDGKGEAPEPKIATILQQNAAIVCRRIEKSRYTLDETDPQTTRDAILIKLTMDQLLANEARTQSLLKDHVRKGLDALTFERLPPSAATLNPRIFFAGPGSGKSTLSGKLKNDHRHKVALIDRSIHRNILLKNKEEALAAWGSSTLLTQEESTEVFLKTIDVFKDLARTGKASPLTIFELSSRSQRPQLDAILDTCRRVGKTAHVSFIHTPLAAARDRAWRRAFAPTKEADRGKFISTEVLLSGHGEISEDFLDILLADETAPALITLLDNSAFVQNPGKVAPATIARADTQTKTMNIGSLDAFKDYLEKSDKISFPNALRRLAQRYTLCLVDPTSGDPLASFEKTSWHIVDGRCFESPAFCSLLQTAQRERHRFPALPTPS